MGEEEGWGRKGIKLTFFFKIKNFRYQLDNNISQKREKRSHLKLF